MAETTERYWVTSKLEKLQFSEIVRLLRLTRWAKDRPEAIIRRSVDHSLNFGVFVGEKQVGYARVVTDYTLFAYLCDVIIDPEYRGRGLAKLLIREITAHPDLQSLRRFFLHTLNAQPLYRQFGFENMQVPAHYMEIFHGG